MRICFVSQEYPPETAKGGIGTQTYAKAHGMARLGHEVHVISRGCDSTRREYDDGDVRVTRLPHDRMAVYTEAADWVAYSAEVAAEVAAKHEQTPLDLVEFPEWGCESYVHLLNQTQWNRVPTVLHLHGPLAMLATTLDWPEKDSEFYRTGVHMEGTCVRLADAVYSSSACSARWCEREYGRKADSIPVIHTGVDIRHFRPKKRVAEGAGRRERPTIVFAGKIARNKGVGTLLEAACRLLADYPDLRLRMLGRGEKEVFAELRWRAARSGTPSLLELPGFVDRDGLPAELGCADVFAAPSRYEGGPGFVYLEAMACGLPVIACEGSGAAEVVHHGENGFLVPPDDVDALAATLHGLLADPRQRELIGAAARRYVEANADVRLCLKRLEAFYREVVASAAVAAAGA
jgi:glycosyltransferase involved in cell wall biosynthesis